MLIHRQKIFLILYPQFENSTTRIAITHIMSQYVSIRFLEGKVAVYKKIHIYIAPNNISNTIELQRLSAVSPMRLLFLHSKSFLLFPHTRSRAEQSGVLISMEPVQMHFLSGVAEGLKIWGFTLQQYGLWSFQMGSMIFLPILKI